MSVSFCADEVRKQKFRGSDVCRLGVVSVSFQCRVDGADQIRMTSLRDVEFDAWNSFTG